MRIFAFLLLLAGLFVNKSVTARDFDVWLNDIRQQAIEKGIRGETVDRALSGLTPNERVVALDRKQPEGTITFTSYRNRVVSQARIDGGIRRMNTHRDLLRRVSARYGVPPELLVTLWGVETSFGGFTGDFSVIRSLASLAHDGRRESLFTEQLLAALQIIDEGHINVEDMTGSWAGAMGQSQFMPTTYLSYAVDFDGDGRKNIWTSLPDVFASAANYLSQAGWDPEFIWGREIYRTEKVDPALIGLEHKAPLSFWQSIGIRKPDQSDLPNADIEASLIVMNDGKGPSFLVYDNFSVLMEWNRSTFFALTVGMLMDKLRAAR